MDSHAPDPSRPFPDDWRPAGREDVVFRRVGEDWVLFDPATQRIHVLNLTAALVWSHCTGELDGAGIEAEVRRAFGAAAPEESGVEGVLRDFRDAGLFASHA